MAYIKERRSLLSIPVWQAIAVGLALLVLFGIAGKFDLENEQMEEDRYCEMVSLWKSDAAAGIPANERRGWPEFRRGEITCQ